MTNSVEKEKIQLPNLLNKLINSNRYPHGILFSGENEDHLFFQMINFAEKVNNSNITTTDMLDDYFEPVTDIIVIKPQRSIKIELIKKLQERIS